jgi:hypothetical protein
MCVTVVSVTTRPDDAVEVAECLAAAGACTGRLGALVLASVRPGLGALDGDGDRWLEMSDLTSAAGVDLVEWFIIGDDIHCPRDLLGEPPRGGQGDDG